MKGATVALVAVVAMFVYMAMPGRAAITCRQVTEAFAPCTPSIISGASPGPLCCSSINNLREKLVTTEDKQAACQCGMDVARDLPAIREDQVKDFLKKCKISIDVPISKDMNCKDIH